MKIAKETWIIMAIGLADLATTILFIENHGAQEANPLFKHYWEMGLAVFIGAKIALLVGPLSILEWARQHRPRFVAWALRTGIVAYIAMYAVGYVQLNHQNVNPRDLEIAQFASQAVRLDPKMTLHVRPVVQAMKQSTAAARPETTSQTVTVY